MYKNEIVITGMGAVSPYGLNIKSLRDGIRNGKNCFSKKQNSDGCLNTVFETKTEFIGAIDETIFPKCRHFDFRRFKKKYKFEQCILLSCSEALNDSGINIRDIGRDRIGVITGSDLYHIISLESYLAEESSEQNTPAAISNFIALNLKLNGPTMTVSAGEASGLVALGSAADYIKYEKCDAVLVGGGSQINDCLLNGFEQLKLLSLASDGNDKYFIRTSNGAILSEGSGYLVVEAVKSAEKRGKTGYAKVLGFGHHAAALKQSDRQNYVNVITESMMSAIADAGISPADVGILYANANGINELVDAEMDAFNAVFSGCHRKPLIAAPKQILGEMLSGGGILNIICAILDIKNKGLTSAIVHDMNQSLTRSEQCRLEQNCDIALVNAASFDGNCASLVLQMLE
jgi:3-oxoacyl-[acyl-carrier-protein] synthase II